MNQSYADHTITKHIHNKHAKIKKNKYNYTHFTQKYYSAEV